MKTLQKFSSVHALVHNHFNQERHLVIRRIYKQRRTAALAEWRALAAYIIACERACPQRIHELRYDNALLKKYAFAPERLVTDDLRSYSAAARELGAGAMEEQSS
jgi:hypothetical protein